MQFKNDPFLLYALGFIENRLGNARLSMGYLKKVRLLQPDS